MSNAGGLKGHDRLDDAGVPGEPAEIGAAPRISERDVQPRLGKQLREMEHDRARFPDRHAVFDEQRHLALGMGIAGVPLTRSVDARDRDDLDLDAVKRVEILQEADDTGRTAARGMEEGQHGGAPVARCDRNAIALSSCQFSSVEPCPAPTASFAFFRRCASCRNPSRPRGSPRRPGSRCARSTATSTACARPALRSTASGATAIA